MTNDPVTTIRCRRPQVTVDSPESRFANIRGECRWWESNPHDLLKGPWILSPMRLPFRHSDVSYLCECNAWHGFGIDLPVRPSRLCLLGFGRYTKEVVRDWLVQPPTPTFAESCLFPITPKVPS